MCGIAGLVRLDGSPVDPAQLDACTDALAHRGPEGRGTAIHGNVGLGHRRLKIIDLSDAAAQPMTSDDGQVAITFNGEIYNYKEKRSLLEAKGYRFRSRSDTEVLLNLYREFGMECLGHLRGMFAFAIHDRAEHRFFLARDRVGKKPLKYFCNRGVFAFASEFKALRTLPECPAEVDREALHHFLTLMYLPSPLTGITGIHKLPAAHFLTLDTVTGALKTERYWSLTRTANSVRSIGEWEERILTLLTESVKLRMVADVPVGAFLSGGLDSATVVALMSALSSSPVRTFTIGSSDPAVDESADAALTARAFGTEHHPIVVQPDIVHLLPELVRFYEEPFADPSSIPTYLVSRETKKHVTVVLNGDGGDENFAGYLRYPILAFSERLSRMPSVGRSLLKNSTALWHALRRDTLSYRAARFAATLSLPWEQRYLQYLSFFTEEEKRSLYRPGFASGFSRTDRWYAGRTASARDRGDTLLHRAMCMDDATYLPDDLLPKVDLGAMAHGIESRSPFLDHRLLELTAGLPDHLQLRGRQGKWIMRRIIKKFLPPQLLTRRKRGFRIPLEAWFRSELTGFLRERLLSTGGSPLFFEIFDRLALERFISQYLASRINYSDHLWALLWLREWCDQIR